MTSRHQSTTSSVFYHTSPDLLKQMLDTIDETIKQQMHTNLISYPRFLKASDITEILSLVCITGSAILSYYGQNYQDHNITLYAGISSTLSLSFSIVSRYLNREAHERQERINNILQSLQRERPPVELGITNSNN